MQVDTKDWLAAAHKSLPAEARFSIRIADQFESSHALRNYFPDGSDEPVHGHTWDVEIFISTPTGALADDGIVFDFLDCKQVLREACSYLDHNHINDLPEFAEVNPTTEHVCLWLYQKVQPVAESKGGTITRIRVWEGPKHYAEINV